MLIKLQLVANWQFGKCRFTKSEKADIGTKLDVTPKIITHRGWSGLNNIV